MRHRKFSQRLSRPTDARFALIRSLVISLFKYQRIKTTRAKAKITQRFAERLITLGKRGSLHDRRRALSILGDKPTVGILFAKIAPLFKNRTSGFTRVIHLSSARRGDGAQMVLLELVEKLQPAKPKEVKKEKAAPKHEHEHEHEHTAAEKAAHHHEVPKHQKPAETEKHKLEGGSEEKAKPQNAHIKPPKDLKPKKFLGGLRGLFKKERDSL